MRGQEQEISGGYDFIHTCRVRLRMRPGGCAAFDAAGGFRGMKKLVYLQDVVQGKRSDAQEGPDEVHQIPRISV